MKNVLLAVTTIAFFVVLFLYIRKTKYAQESDKDKVRIAPDGEYEGYQVVYDVFIPKLDLKFRSNVGYKCGSCQIPVVVTIKNGLAEVIEITAPTQS